LYRRAPVVVAQEHVQGSTVYTEIRPLGEHWSVQKSGLWQGSTVYTERAAIREHSFLQEILVGSIVPDKRAAFGRGARFTPNGRALAEHCFVQGSASGGGNGARTKEHGLY